MGLPHLPRSVSRQKQTRPRSFRACRTAAVDARRCRRTSQRTAIPRAKLGKVQRCRCGQVPAAALLGSSRDVEGVADPRYAKRPYAALYAIGPLILFPIPSSPHCTLKVSEHDSLWQPPAAHAYERPAHRSLLVRNVVSMFSHRVISRARLYEVILWPDFLRCAPMMRRKTRWFTVRSLA